MNEVKVHVETLDAFAERSLAMARQLDRGERRSRPAHISFETMEALLKVLTPGRWTLLRRLRADGPSSIRALARVLGRDYRGVHADITTLIECGLVMRGSDGKVSVPWSRITAEMALDSAA
jgi:predicted transcriptional regulator